MPIATSNGRSKHKKITLPPRINMDQLLKEIAPPPADKANRTLLDVFIETVRPTLSDCAGKEFDEARMKKIMKEIYDEARLRHKPDAHPEVRSSFCAIFRAVIPDKSYANYLIESVAPQPQQS